MPIYEKRRLIVKKSKRERENLLFFFMNTLIYSQREASFLMVSQMRYIVFGQWGALRYICSTESLFWTAYNEHSDVCHTFKTKCCNRFVTTHYLKSTHSFRKVIIHCIFVGLYFNFDQIIRLLQALQNVKMPYPIMQINCVSPNFAKKKKKE